eukprot:SAG31_NODE_12311_length_950_cov_1.392479_2_plen_155_part_01
MTAQTSVWKATAVRQILPNLDVTRPHLQPMPAYFRLMQEHRTAAFALSPVALSISPTYSVALDRRGPVSSLSGYLHALAMVALTNKAQLTLNNGKVCVIHQLISGTQQYSWRPNAHRFYPCHSSSLLIYSTVRSAVKRATPVADSSRNRIHRQL